MSNILKNDNSDLLIEIRNLYKSYDGKKNVLNDLNFHLRKGEMVVIEGKSGSGKSTLMNIIGLLDGFDSGTFILNGKRIRPHSQTRYSKMRASLIGFVFQSYYLIDSISVRENIMLPLLYCDKSMDKNLKDTYMSLLKELDIIHLENKKVALLSGGEKQRVALARAILKNPEIIIADEPTGNLDSENKGIVIGILRKLVQNGKSVIMVTHDVSISNETESIYSLKEGKLEACR